MDLNDCVGQKKEFEISLPQSDVVDLAPDGLSRSSLLTLSGQFFTETLAPIVQCHEFVDMF